MLKKVITVFMTIGFFFGMTAAALETTKGLKKDYTKFKQEMTVQMQNLETKIEILKEKTKTKADAAQIKALAELEESRDKVRTELAELETETKTDWKKMKKKIAASVDRLNRKAQEMLKKE